MADTKRTLGAVGIALTGAAVGYVAGVLSAPASGRDTRRRLGRRLEDEADDLTRKAEHTLRDAKNKISHALR
jgi:gas vesicle protein